MSPGRASDVVESLQRVLERREAARAPVRAARVVGRNQDGSAQLQRLDGECVARGGVSGYDGEIVVQLPSLVDRQGTAGVAALARRDTAPLLWVERLEPSVFPAGATGLVVTVIGHGFTPATVIEFLRPASEEVNTNVTLVGQSFVSESELQLTIDIASGATPISGAPIAYYDPTRR